MCYMYMYSYLFDSSNHQKKPKNYDSLTKSNEAFGLYKTFSSPGPHACLKRQLNVGVPSDGITEMRLSQHVWHYKDPSLPKR